MTTTGRKSRQSGTPARTSARRLGAWTMMTRGGTGGEADNGFCFLCQRGHAVSGLDGIADGRTCVSLCWVCRAVDRLRRRAG